MNFRVSESPGTGNNFRQEAKKEKYVLGIKLKGEGNGC